jgi:hAT family C-terminal dimerisation region
MTCRVCQILAVLPATSVDCERGFSALNSIKSLNRNQLSNETLELLMRIRLTDMDEETLISEHSDELLDTWWRQRERRSGDKDDVLLINRPNWMPMENSLYY